MDGIVSDGTEPTNAVDRPKGRVNRASPSLQCYRHHEGKQVYNYYRCEANKKLKLTSSGKGTSRPGLADINKRFVAVTNGLRAP